MIKMMVIVVIVFTVCWLPFNILLVTWDNDESIGSWHGLPYLYFAFHWLAMSHSCYNPVIYCWMNARFRAGFCLALSHIPPLRRLFPNTGMPRHHGTASITGIALTGMDATENSELQRVNTCNTYVSTKRKSNTNSCSPPRSVSLRLSGEHVVTNRRLLTNEDHI